MDFELTAEHLMLKDLCRDFARKEIAPYADEWFDEEYFPVEVFRKMADLNLMGMLIPEEYGGSGSGTMAMVAALEEIGEVISRSPPHCRRISLLVPCHFSISVRKSRSINRWRAGARGTLGRLSLDRIASWV